MSRIKDLEAQEDIIYESTNAPSHLVSELAISDQIRNGNRHIRVCGQSNSICVGQAKEDMEKVYGNGSSCHCLPGCFELIFTDSKSYGRLSEKTLHFELNGKTVKNIAVAHFYFPNSKFTKQMKSELFGFTEILANAGGLLGLCMGFSFLSIVEIIYFVTLRVICTHSHAQIKKFIKRRGKSRFDNTSVYPFIK